jgi:hypothetical protein
LQKIATSSIRSTLRMAIGCTRCGELAPNGGDRQSIFCELDLVQPRRCALLSLRFSRYVR